MQVTGLRLVSLGWISFEDDGWPDIPGYILNSDADRPVIFGSEVDPYHYVLSAHIHCRHLTAEQKRDLIAKVLKARPEKSNRTIGKQTKADHKTVGAVRDKLEARGETPHVSTVEDIKGRKQPTKKKRRDVDDYISEKKAMLAAKAVEAPDVIPPSIDITKPINTNTPVITKLKKEINALSMELEIFGEDYSASVRDWCEAHPNGEYTSRLVSALGQVSHKLQMLAQEISSRNPDINDEARRALLEDAR